MTNFVSGAELEALNIIVKGSGSNPDKDHDVAADKAIQVLSVVAESNPTYLLKIIRDAFELTIDGMVSIALAVLSARASDEFLSDRKNSAVIVAILSQYPPPILLDYVELMKSKAFGRGFGSRPQKWARAAMEGWNLKVITSFCDTNAGELYSLIRLVHPRFHGARGEVINERILKIKTVVKQ